MPFKEKIIVGLLFAPFGGYGVYQVYKLPYFHSDSNTDKIYSSSMPTKDQIAARKMATTQGVHDVQRLYEFYFQFKMPGPGEKFHSEECRQLAAALAERSSTFTNLEKFLSGVDTPDFVEGNSKKYFVDLHELRKDSLKIEREMELWLTTGFANVNSVASSDQAYNTFSQILGRYLTTSKLQNAGRVSAWKAQFYIQAIKSLDIAAKDPYAKVLNIPLPLPTEGESADVQAALTIPRAILKHSTELKSELDKITAAHYPFAEQLLANGKEAMRISVEWEEKSVILALFADTEPFADPSKLGDWVRKIDLQLTRATSGSARDLIRRKIQEFCQAYIPVAAKLDEDVLIDNMRVSRSEVKIVYASDAKTKPLTDNPFLMNEFNFAKIYDGFDGITWAEGGKTTSNVAALRPTLKSQIARDYALTRKPITSWGQKEMTAMKKIWEGAEMAARRDLLNELIGLSVQQGPGRINWTKANTKIWTRLMALSDMMDKFPTLFD